MSEDTGTASDQAFSALGSPLRLEILRVLVEAAEAGDHELSFSDIYDRVDIDSTSQLSYHLDTLTASFVHNTARGYTLTQAGDRVVRVVRSGTYSEEPSFDPTTIEGQCPYCVGTVLTADYRDAALAVECDSCHERVVTFDLPPAEARDRTSLEILHSCNRRAHQEYATALQGSCPTCGGSTTTTIEQHDEPTSYICVAACRQCGLRRFAPLEVRLLHHPAVVSFYWAFGIDASTLPLWDLPSYVANWEIEPTATDPYEFEITVVHDGDSVRVAVDAELNVSVLTA